MGNRRQRDLDVGKLMKLLAEYRASQDLKLYFGGGLGKGELPPFTGGRFEFLDGGGNRAGACNRITASDVLSLELLSVQLPPQVALDLLEGGLGEEIAVFLARIPASLPLWDELAGELIADSGPADRIWHLLKGQDGVGWVTAGKLLARKRPSLIPVYDDIVRCAFGSPENIWTALREALCYDNGFRSALEDLKKRAGIPEEVTLLRTLDVAVWMRHRMEHTGHRCVGLT